MYLITSSGKPITRVQCACDANVNEPIQYNTIQFYCSNRFTKCDLKVHTKLRSICSKPVVRQLGYRLSLWGKHMASAITLPYSCTVIANGMNGHTTACVRNTFPFTWSSITL